MKNSSGTLIGPDTVVTTTLRLLNETTVDGNTYTIPPSSIASSLTIYLGAYNLSFITENSGLPPEVIVAGAVNVKIV